MLGFSMRVERADVSAVKDRLAELKRKLHTTPAPRPSALQEYTERLASQEAEKEAFKKRRKEETEAKKAQAKALLQEQEESDEESGIDPAMAAMMGFKGFGTTKR